jgi:hypothetical protein
MPSFRSRPSLAGALYGIPIQGPNYNPLICCRVFVICEEPKSMGNTSRGITSIIKLAIAINPKFLLEIYTSLKILPKK